VSWHNEEAKLRSKSQRSAAGQLNWLVKILDWLKEPLAPRSNSQELSLSFICQAMNLKDEERRLVKAVREFKRQLNERLPMTIRLGDRLEKSTSGAIAKTVLGVET
jgi:hypothetical protein